MLAACTTRLLMFSSSDGDFVERAFGRRDDVGGALRVVDRLVDAGDLAAQPFGGDQTGGIVGAAVDPQAGRSAAAACLFSVLLTLARPSWAVRDATFVLMRAMPILHDCLMAT